MKTQLYSNTDSSQPFTDRNAIQQLKRDDVKHEYLEFVEHNSELRDSWRRIEAELDRSPLGKVSGSDSVEEIKWWNCSRDHLNQQTPADRSKPRGVLRSLKDWENMVEFWHSIRSNLFHGGKDPERERDQFLVEFGYKTLRKLMTILLGE